MLLQLRLVPQAYRTLKKSSTGLKFTAGGPPSGPGIVTACEAVLLVRSCAAGLDMGERLHVGIEIPRVCHCREFVDIIRQALPLSTLATYAP